MTSPIPKKPGLPNSPSIVLPRRRGLRIDNVERVHTYSSLRFHRTETQAPLTTCRIFPCSLSTFVKAPMVYPFPRLFLFHRHQGDHPMIYIRAPSKNCKVATSASRLPFHVF